MTSRRDLGDIVIQPPSTPPTTGMAARCEPVLRALPDWFGIEDSVREYLAATDAKPTILALDRADVVGFLTLERHFPESAEIHVVGVLPAYHRRGIGRMMQDAAERWCRQQGVRVLQVKTLADGHPSVHYARTRAFYRGVGFVPMEIFPTLWHPRHPCLQLVKIIA